MFLYWKYFDIVQQLILDRVYDRQLHSLSLHSVLSTHNAIPELHSENFDWILRLLSSSSYSLYDQSDWTMQEDNEEEEVVMVTKYMTDEKMIENEEFVTL